MKHCNICDVDVRGDRELCPLCQRPLSGEGEPAVFPVIPTVYSKYSVFFRLLLLGSVIAVVTSLLVNFLVPQSGRWSLYVLLGIGCLWVALIVGFKTRKNIAKNIANMAFVVGIFCIVWDLVTGWRAWSVNFVVPIDCMVSLVALVIVARLTKLPVEEYMLFLLLAVVFGLIPLVLYLTGVVTFAIPSLVCIAFSIVFLVALWLFEGKNIVAEVQKRLHF